MNNFIKKMLALGAELDKATDPMQCSMIINDAEILYKNEIEALNTDILDFAKREKRMSEGNSEECIQERDDEEQSMMYTGQAEAYENLITWLSSR